MHINKPKPWWHNKKDVSGAWSRRVTCHCSHSFSSFCFIAPWSNLTPIKLISYSQTPTATEILLDPSCTVRRTYTIIICHTDTLWKDWHQWRMLIFSVVELVSIQCVSVTPAHRHLTKCPQNQRKSHVLYYVSNLKVLIMQSSLLRYKWMLTVG